MLKAKPRVTEILRTLGLSKSYDGVDPFYRERGTAVHKCIELHLQGVLDESSVDEVCLPYLEGFKKFWNKEGDPGGFDSELHLETDDFQGTIDLVCKGVIWDFKNTKNVDRAAECQGSGYKALFKAAYGLELPFKVVQFPGDGSFRIHDYDAPVELWDSILRVYQWKTRR